MALHDPNIMPSSRLGCPLSLKTPNMGNTGLERYQSTNTEVGRVLSTVSLGTPAFNRTRRRGVLDSLSRPRHHRDLP